MAAVAWVGGGIFYFFVLRPTIKAAPNADTSVYNQVGQQFRHLVTTAIVVLIITGVVLTLSRLTSEHGGFPYIIVLAVKVGLAAYMFYLARFFRRPGYMPEPVGTNVKFRKLSSIATGATTVLALGVIVFLLADVLTSIVEQGLRS